MQPSRPPASVVRLRLIVVTTAAVLVIVPGALWWIGQRFTTVPALWIGLPLVLGTADLVLVPAVGSTIRPLPYGTSPRDARRISVGVLRTVTVLRQSLAAAPAVFGLISSLVTGSLMPYALGATFAVPLLLGLVYPSRRVVEAVRLRLESSGVASGVWGADPPRR